MIEQAFEEKIIDDKKYEIYKFTTTDAIKTFSKIAKIIGPSMAAILTGGSISNFLEMDTSEIKLDEAIKDFCLRLDEDIVLEIILKLMSHTYFISPNKNHGGKVSQIFDLHFQGKLSHLMKVTKAAMEVQYGDFLGGLADLRKI